VGLAGATKKRKTFVEKAAKLDFVSSSQATREEQPLPVGYIPTPSHTLQQPPSTEDDREEEEHITTEADNSTANEEEVEKEVGKWLVYSYTKFLLYGFLFTATHTVVICS